MSTRSLYASDHLPSVFQANIDRLFQRVIWPGLNNLAIHDQLEFGEAATMDEFLSRAAAQVDNHIANEAAKAYTLALAATFERQMRIWLRSRQPELPAKQSERFSFADLLGECSGLGDVDMETGDLGVTLSEMFEVANVFRHGDGRAVRKLMEVAPRFWSYAPSRYVDISTLTPDESEKLLLNASDVCRYTQACARFWGLIDSSPSAVTNPRYW